MSYKLLAGTIVLTKTGTLRQQTGNWNKAI